MNIIVPSIIDHAWGTSTKRPPPEDSKQTQGLRMHGVESTNGLVQALEPNFGGAAVAMQIHHDYHHH